MAVHLAVPHIEAEEGSADGAERGEHCHPLAWIIAIALEHVP